MINKKRLRKMKKQSLSIRTKILVSLMLVFTVTILVATFSDIIQGIIYMRLDSGSIIWVGWLQCTSMVKMEAPHRGSAKRFGFIGVDQEEVVSR